MLGSIGVPEMIIILCFVGFIGVVAILPFWMIFSKAGFSGWMSLTQLVPLIHVVALFHLAFAEWPIQRELRESGRPR